MARERPVCKEKYPRRKKFNNSNCKSARGLAQSRTLRARRGTIANRASSHGLRRPSAVFFGGRLFR
jgi:hypothetical protein